MSEFRSSDEVRSATAPLPSTLVASLPEGLAGAVGQAEASATLACDATAVDDVEPAPHEPPLPEPRERSFQRCNGAQAKRGKRLVKPEEATVPLTKTLAALAA